MQAPEPNDNNAKLNEKSSANTLPPESPEPPLPRRFERYTLLKRIARGGMGEVFLAAAGGIEGAERPCVVKTIRREHEGDRSFLARFLDEARIQAQLQHPGVAQIVEATNDAEGKPYVVVEYIEGRNLSDVRSRAGQLNVRIAWPEALAFGIALGEALAHVHERTDANGKPLEIVHRDLSPQNVMVGYGGELKLIDFGTARGQNRRCHTVAGIVFAKPGYVAPEVANNTPGGVPADLYAYGIMLWELLAGRRFLVGEAAVHMALVGAGKRQPTPLSQLLGAPAEIDQVIAQLTAAKVEDRYTSARHAISDLVKLLQRSPSMANGDRSVRGRVAQLMARLYPAEPARSRADFARMVAEARAVEPPRAAAALQPSPSPASVAEADPNVLPGTRYRIMREIGRGGMGVVYEAYHVDLIRFVALKVLDKDSVSEDMCSRLRAEARAIAGLSHENLVKLYDFGIAADGRPFYAMELLAGESLDKKLERDGACSVREAVELTIQACRALEAAHAAGVVHRDIKPANLMLSADQRLRLLDFGVAKAEAELESRAEAGTGAFTLVGTPEYMAPEQARGQADARSDVYALGAVLYELVSGRRPHEGETTLALLEEKRKDSVVPLSDRAVGISPALDRVVLAALQADPARRPQSAAEFRACLEAALRQPVRASSRRRGVAYTAASIIAMTAIGISAMAVGKSALPSRAAQALAPLVARLDSKSKVKSPPSKASVAPVANVAIAEPDAILEEEIDESETSEGEVANAEPVIEVEPSDAESGPSEVSEADQGPSDGAVLAEVERLRKNGSKLKALDILRRAARSTPKDPAVLKQLTAMHEELKAWGEAAKAARQWVKAEPSVEAQLELARLERATGHRDRAVKVLSKLLKEAPETSEATALLAELTDKQRVALR